MGHKIDSSEQGLNNQIKRRSEKEMAYEVAEILKPAHSGKNAIGVSSERKEDCISWEDEILAAEAMAIMQHMQRAGGQIHPRAEGKCESSAMATGGFGVGK